MRPGILICTVFLLASASSGAAQMCNDDLAGLTIDERGRYVFANSQLKDQSSAAAPVSRRASASSAKPVDAEEKPARELFEQFLEKVGTAKVATPDTKEPRHKQ